jgi:hypothetical protein
VKVLMPSAGGWRARPADRSEAEIDRELERLIDAITQASSSLKAQRGGWDAG